MSNYKNPSLGYNPYFDPNMSKSENNRYTSEYEETSEYVDNSDFRESYSTSVGTHDSVVYSEDAAIQRQPSKKLLINDPNNIGRGDSLRKLARGDSVKKIPNLDKFDPFSANGPTVVVKKPVTKFEKLQAWMINEGGRAIFFWGMVALHGLVFALAFLNYFYSDNLTTARKNFGITYTIARSAALVLHLDAAMILFPVCRNLISIFRATPLNNIIPFDENIEFHKAIGWSILFFSLLHTAAHWVNFARFAAATGTTVGSAIIVWLELNFETGPGVTGYVMLISLLIMVATARETARRSHFNKFWYSHHLFIPFFGAWAFHGAFCMIQPDREPKCDSIANFWKYWILSGVIYIGERVYREIRARRESYISKVVMHPSRVVEIQIKKPSMTTKAGQYIFICCPEVSLWEWHPFTLTSAPEEDYISVHIRVVGDFTKALSKKLGCDFDEELRIRKENKDRIKSQYDGIDISTNNIELQKVLPRIMVDGPFGSASEDVFKFEVAMLVGAGIGVTPFASILKSIWYRVNYPTKSTKLSKVYFFWVCRDYDSFEWFQSLLSAIEEQDIEQFIETHIYLTGRLRHSEVGNIHLNDDGNIKDTITGLRAPTHFGRPNWDRIFSSMRDQYSATDIGVFFCGPVPLGKTLHTKCNLWSQGFEGGTRFFYGKENF